MDKELKTKKKKLNTSVLRVIIFIIFTIYAITLLVPFVYGFSISLKTRAEYNSGNLMGFPKSMYFKNYLTAWSALKLDDGTNMITMTINSLWYAAGSVLLSLIFSVTSAYVIAKYKFPGRMVIYVYALIVMMIPLMGTMPASVKFYKLMGAYNNPLFVFFSAQTAGYLFIILYATFKGVSWEYAEAGIIDGAGHFRIFTSIMLPQVVTVMSALFVTQFITMWSDSATPLIYLPNFPTLASGLLVYQTITEKQSNIPVLFAGLFLSMIPLALLFYVFQEKIMDIQIGGGLKG